MPLISSVSAGGVAPLTSSAIDTTGATLLVLNVAYSPGTTPVVTDSMGNTWIAITLQTITNVEQRLFYVWNPTVGTGHTFTVSGSGTVPSFEVSAHSGVPTDANPYQDQQGYSFPNATQAGAGAASLTPTTASNLVVVGIGLGASETGFSAQNGFTLVAHKVFTAGQYEGSALVYLEQTTAAPVTTSTAVASWTGSANIAVGSAVFKMGGGGSVTGVTVTPSTATVAGGATQQFTAVVAGTSSPSQAGTWTTTLGAVDTNGLFTAPTATGASQTATVRFTSQQDATKSGTATVTIPATTSTVTSVTVSPATAAVAGGFTQQFTASVSGTGSPSQAVAWTATLGSISSSGLYTAPTATGSDQSATVRATSQQDGTKSGTAIVTVPAVIGPTAFVLPQYADAVREAVGSVAGSAIIITGVTPMGYRTFSAAFPASVQGIPVRIEEAGTANWVLVDVTLTSATQLTVTRVYQGSNGSSMPTFGAGAKSAFCVLPASQIVRRDWIDGNSYFPDPTFTNDSTAAIQNAVNDAYTLGIGVIRYSSGRYKIAGALVTNVGGYNPNSQIYIPQTRQYSPTKTIIFEGICPPNFEQQVLRDSTLAANGVIFESTIVGSGTKPAVFAMVPGNTSDEAGWQFNYTNIGFANLGVRTSVTGGANQMCGINLINANQVVKMDLVRVDINMGLVSSPSPVSVSSTGITLPRRYNHLITNGGAVYVSGYNTGLSFYEHTCFLNVTVIGCWNALSLEDSDHASYIGLLSIEGCVNGIVQNGNHGLAIGQLDSEHIFKSGTWYQFSRDIKWNSGSRKITVLQSTVVVSDVGVSDAAFTADANAVYKIVSGAGAN